MSCTNAVSNIVIEPVDLYWGSQHRVCFQLVDDVSGSLGGDYFTFSTPTKKGYIWLSTGASIDPAPAGFEEFAEVLINNNDTAETIAGLVAAALNSVSATIGVHALASDSHLIIEAKAMGEVLAAATVAFASIIK